MRQHHALKPLVTPIKRRHKPQHDVWLLKPHGTAHITQQSVHLILAKQRQLAHGDGVIGWGEGSVVKRFIGVVITCVYKVKIFLVKPLQRDIFPFAAVHHQIKPKLRVGGKLLKLLLVHTDSLHQERIEQIGFKLINDFKQGRGGNIIDDFLNLQGC